MTGWLRLVSPISPQPSFISTCHSSICFYPKYKLLKLEFSHLSTWCSSGFSNNGRKLQCNNMMISTCRISFPPITSCSSYMLEQTLAWQHCDGPSCNGDILHGLCLEGWVIYLRHMGGRITMMGKETISIIGSFHWQWKRLLLHSPPKQSGCPKMGDWQLW